MIPERWKKVEDLFQSALDLSAGEREKFLRDECADDAELLGEVEKLIARFEKEETFLESPVWTDSQFLQSQAKREIAASLEENLEPDNLGKSHIGERIGVYRLTEELGKGGMGVVYAAERDDGEFRQKVAIKLIKRGMDTDFIVKRFRFERQILANLNHPNIARLLDGGTTDDGSPYFIMEFIEGAPFLAFCRARNLDLRRKLELFSQICRAIQYAHHKKIIHRDIKPSNIIVTEDGEPKLLDFGIAKILDAEAFHESIAQTATAMRLMTPEYASPEQIKGERVTAASDQYSLGVLLYELITGARPYKFPSRAPHEIARVICEEIPSEPSSGEFGKLITSESFKPDDPDFCKKLDRIVLKALQKQPEARYASVEDFAADIERFLRGEKVTADFPAGAENSVEILPPATAERKNETIAVAPAAEKPEIEISASSSVSPRRRGVKQGIFSIILSFLLIPVYIILFVTDFIDAVVTISIFLILLFGGILRILYALMFEPGKGQLIEIESSAGIDNPVSTADSFADLETIAGNQTTGEKTNDTKNGEKSIAVLPFENLSIATDENESSEFLSIGLADALIARLTNVRQFVVRPTSSVLRFAGESDPFAAGESLNVEYILAGNIVHSGQKIRLSLQLLDVKKRSIVWTERFDENFTDVLEFEDSISGKVADSLLPHLTGEERRQLEKRGTNNADAYEAFMRGRFHFNIFTEDSLKQAIAYYQKAVQLDPNYAPAYAGIADYFIWLGIFGVLPPSQTYQTAKQMAQQAIEIDGELAEAYAALGFAQLCGNYDWKSGERNILRAIDINPNYAVAHNWLAILLYSASRFDEGITHAEKSIELDPLTYQNYRTLSWGYYFSRQFDESLEVITETIEKFPLTGTALANRGWLLRAMGRSNDSLRDSAEALQTAGNSIFVQTGHAQALAAAGKMDEAEKLIDALEANPKVKYLSYYQVSVAYCYANEKEKALNALERAAKDRDGWILWLNVEPALDILRGELRFEKLLGEIAPPNVKIREEASIQSPKIIPAKFAESFSPKNDDPKTVAVLPFKNLDVSSNETPEEVGFLSVGLADALITRISNVRPLIVRPTSSVLKFGASQIDSFAAGQELNVRFIVDGNIAAAGRRVRVSVQLLDVENRSTVWAERFEEDFTDVLEIEDLISARVVESLIPHLSGEQRRQIEKRGTDNAKAYEAYLRGRAAWNTFTEEGLRQALGFFNRAIELDPNYAMPHAAIADYYVWVGMFSLLPVGEFYPKAKNAALRAIELDPQSSEAYAALGLTELYGRYDWQSSEKYMRRAVEINPHNAIAHSWFTHNLFTRGKFEEGRRHLDRSIELDPLSFQNHNTYSWGLYFERHLPEALTKADDVIERFPTSGHPYFTKSTFLRFAGRTKESLEFSFRALQFSQDKLITFYGHASALAADGKREEALKIIEGDSVAEYPSDYHMAIVHVWLQEYDKAFERLEKAAAVREGALIWLAIEPSFDPVRGDARYKRILEKINHPLAGKTVSAPQVVKPAKIIEEENRDAETVKSKFGLPDAVKYILFAVIALAFGYIVYNVATKTKIEFGTPPDELLSRVFASKMNAKMLTTGGSAPEATLAPDGKQIAYALDEAGRQSLWLRSLDSENVAQLVAPDTVLYTHLAFSPDGKYVYYVISRAPERTLYRVSTAGGAPQKISGNVLNLFAISPDGRRIIYDNRNTDNMQNSMFIAELDEQSGIKSAQTLFVLDSPNYFPGGFSFSPDGKKIVYPRSVIDGNKEVITLFVYDLETRKNERLGTTDFDRVNATEWRGTGEEIVISARENDAAPHRLWIVDYPTGETTRLSNDFNIYFGLSLSTDSSVLSTTKIEETSNLWTGELTAADANYDSKIKQITFGNNRQDGLYGVNWTRDGRILYTSASGAERDITLMNPDGTNSRRIATGAIDPKFPALSADNRYLIYADEKGGEVNIWRFDLTSQLPERISTKFAVTPTLAPDNQNVFYATLLSASSNKLTIHQKTLSGGEEIALTGATSVRPVVSPDNRFVACNYASDETEGRWQIAILPVRQGEAEPRIIKPYSKNFFRNPQARPLAWSPDGRFLYFLNNANNVVNIFRVEVGDAAALPTQVTHFKSGEIFDFSIAPDGKSAVIARGAIISRIIIFQRDSEGSVR